MLLTSALGPPAKFGVSACDRLHDLRVKSKAKDHLQFVLSMGWIPCHFLVIRLLRGQKMKTIST